MMHPRPAHVAAFVALATLAFGAQASLSGAEEPAQEVYGTVDAIDPLVGFDWAPPVTPSLHVHLICHFMPAS